MPGTEETSKPTDNNVSNIAEAMAKNSTTSIINALLKKKFAFRQISSDDPQQAELVDSALGIGQGIAEAMIGVAMIGGGAVLALVPHKGLVIDTIDVSLVDKDDEEPQHSDEVPLVDGVRLVDFEKRNGVFYTHVESEKRNWENGARFDPATVVNNEVARPALPLVDSPPPVIDAGKRKKPLFSTKTSTTLTGVGVMTAGVSVTASGVYNAVAGLTNTVVTGGTSLYNRFFTQPPKPPETPTKTERLLLK